MSGISGISGMNNMSGKQLKKPLFSKENKEEKPALKLMKNLPTQWKIEEENKQVV